MLWRTEVQQIEVMGKKIGRESFFVIGGPCVLESGELALKVASFMQQTCTELGIPYVFKSSYDKANRSSISSYRGPGIDEGLRILACIREELQIPVLTDIHSVGEAERVAEVVDIIQIPAFLARQTDLLVAAAKTGKPVNLKKAQFMAPWDMEHVVAKIRQSGNEKIILTERGTLFGYNNLVVDMRSIAIMAQSGFPVVFDATHSVQLPGGRGICSGGERQYVGPLARAAIAAGAHGLFVETHEAPDEALCDGPNSLPLSELPPLFEDLLEIYRLVRRPALKLQN